MHLIVEFANEPAYRRGVWKATGMLLNEWSVSNSFSSLLFLLRHIDWDNTIKQTHTRKEININKHKEEKMLYSTRGHTPPCLMFNQLTRKTDGQLELENNILIGCHTWLR
jgi:hypothetical protein